VRISRLVSIALVQAYQAQYWLFNSQTLLHLRSALKKGSVHFSNSFSGLTFIVIITDVVPFVLSFHTVASNIV
jgi:alkylhydroperoxidase/carboxymuconolactone decarboxylase family protein YurZ